MNEIRQNIPESERSFYFLFGIRIGTALTHKAKENYVDMQTHCTRAERDLKKTGCLTLKHTGSRCNALWSTGIHWNTLTYAGIHCNTLQFTTTHYHSPPESHCRKVCFRGRRYENYCQDWKGWVKGSRLQVVPGSLTFRTQFRRGPCTCSEKLYDESHFTKDQRGEVTILKTEVWKHMHTFKLHTFYPTRLASEWYAVWYCPRKPTHRKIRVTTNSLTKGRVEVVQLNCYHKTIIGNTHSWLVLKESSNPIIVYNDIYVLQEWKFILKLYQIVWHTILMSFKLYLMVCVV